nr:pentapeptide repeat-containing protein [Serratia marcescens]
MASLLYKNTGIDMTLALVGEKIDRNRFTGEKVENSTFFNCDFSGADLSGTEFIGCQFYDRESQKGCNFSRAMLKDAIFKSCDLSMADFRNVSALGIEIRPLPRTRRRFPRCKLYEYDHHAHLVLQRIYH